MNKWIIRGYGIRDSRIKFANDINITLMPDDIYIIHGTSGTGKSTLLKILLSQLTPDNGTVNRGGKGHLPEPLNFPFRINSNMHFTAMDEPEQYMGGHGTVNFIDAVKSQIKDHAFLIVTHDKHIIYAGNKCIKLGVNYE